MKRLGISAFSVSLLMGVLAFAAACGGDDDGTTPEGTSPAAQTSAAAQGPGTITLTSTAIEGQSGKILLVFATAEGGQERLARLCRSIDSDSFELSGGTLTDVPSGDDPCGGDTPATTFDEGTYQVTAGVYVGGQQEPEKQATVTVTVAGDVTAELDGGSLSR